MRSAARAAARWVRCAIGNVGRTIAAVCTATLWVSSTDSLPDPVAIGPLEDATSSVSGQLWRGG